MDENPMADEVVVITGASSGIGRATALLLASRGAKLLLLARRRDVLEDAARQCREAGSPAVEIKDCDVVDAAQVLEAAALAADRLGAIDAWINNAGVYAMGLFEEMPEEVHERVLEVNYFGVLNGARAALPHLRKSRGVLVNVSSTLGLMGAPFLTAYCASKHAVRGFSEALRDEERDHGVHVACVFPPAVDTPLFEHAANYTGKVIKPAPPVLRPEQIARAIVDKAIARRRREVVIGPNKVVNALHSLLPPVMERMMTRKVRKEHFLEKREGPHEGNLFEPQAKGQSASAGWKDPPFTALLKAFPSALRETLRSE